MANIADLTAFLAGRYSFGSEYVLDGSYLPDLVVIADPRNMINVIKECNLKNVPTMGTLRYRGARLWSRCI